MTSFIPEAGYLSPLVFDRYGRGLIFAAACGTGESLCLAAQFNESEDAF